MNVMTMTTAPVAMKFPARAWWLLTLLPVNVLAAFQLRRGHFAAGPTLATFIAVLPLLALVAWSEWAKSPRAIRLRAELRLVMPVGVLLLLATGLGQVLPLVASSTAGLAQTLSEVVSVVLPSAVILVPLTWEAERGSLPMLMTSPLAGRVLGEKFAVAALIIVASWLQVTLAPGVRDDGWWFALAGHAVPLATALPWFFFAKKDVSSLGLTLVVPMFFVAPFVGFEWAPGIVGVLVIYMVTMLMLVPRALRRGVFAPGFGESWALHAPGGPERRLAPLLGAELREQREAMLIGALSLVVGAALFAYRELQAGMVFFLSASAATMSVALSFSEARRQGTLDARLALMPRARVFREKALASLAVTFVMSVVAPVALLMSLGAMELSHAPTWALEMAVVWSVALACSVEVSGAAVSLAVSSLATVLVSVISFVVFAVGFFGASMLFGRDGHGPNFVVALFVIVVASALFVAQRRFVGLVSLDRLMAVTAGFVLFSALSFGVAATVLG
ncbi:MAG: hypothetical protein ACO1OB_02985 [Archangium sp.]